ncbi:MAG: ATP-dependent RNA/DNA helicase IGHMBP2 [Crocinitomicaceae bacterium]|jgi:ATP-dependent RNA/DNA helicase IGHMBP2
MEERHPFQEQLLKVISLEMRGQEKKYALGPESSLKQLKSYGVVLHPITVIRKTFGYADYPEISFKLPFACDTSSFKDNSAIECFLEGEESIKGMLLGLDGHKGDFRLFAPEFPDWIEEKGVGIKLAPDHRTAETMKRAIEDLDEPSRVRKLFLEVHGTEKFGEPNENRETLEFQNEALNESQRNAVAGIVANEELILLHGPPGTGKTTTLIEAIVQKVKLGKRILVTAPSNAAVDNIALGLVQNGLKILRVGNTLKVNQLIFPHTPEGRMLEAKEYKEIKKLKIRAEELRRMSFQYKRNFGRDERQQRTLLIRESKNLRREIREIRKYFDSKLYKNADVVLGTPIGLDGFLPTDAEFDLLVMDEAGQAIEPLAWVVFPYAQSWVLAGDPFQLPPTVISQEAINAGFSVSILEHCFKNCQAIYFLDTQYRMRKSIADFSSRYFYEDKLITPANQQDVGDEVIFYDTAGTGYEEQRGKDGVSLMNEGELSVIQKIVALENLNLDQVAFISPYAGQVQLAKEYLDPAIKTSTIDSFQGQEKEIIILSLVRSNTDAVIGFLKDYRRMNVALTRAKSRLFVIGDSSTIGQDKFYASFLEYVEEIEGYRSAWELAE